MNGRGLGLICLAVAILGAGCSHAAIRGPASSRPATPATAATPSPSGPPISIASLSGRVTFSMDDDIFVMRADGSHVRRLTTRPGSEFDPTWSPDGGRMAYRDSRRGINHDDEIYVMNADGSGQRNLTRNRANDWGPAWSPDGSMIAFNSDRDLLPQLYVVRPDGTHLRRLTEIEAEYPAWSPDGKRIAFMSMQPDARGSDPNYDVFVVNADGSGLRQLTDWPGEDGWPAWSRDGRLIAFTTSHDDHGQSGDIGPYFDIWVMNSDGSGKRRLSSNFGMFPVWSPDGSVLMYAGDRLWVVRPDGSGLASVGSGTMPDWVPA